MVTDEGMTSLSIVPCPQSLTASATGFPGKIKQISRVKSLAKPHSPAWVWKEHLKCLVNLLWQDFSHALSPGRGNDCKAPTFEALHLSETCGPSPG